MQSGSHNGQSLLEVIIATAIGALLIATAAGLLVPALRTNSQSGQIQIGAALAKQLGDNVMVLSEGNWHAIDGLATTSATKYYLNATSSPFTVTTGTESVVIATTTYTRSFYISNVNRDGSGYITTGAGTDDPSTKKITVEYKWPNVATSTLTFYVTRYKSNAYNQTDWANGSGQNGAYTTTVNGYSSSSNISATAVPGSIQLAAAGGLGIAYVQGISNVVHTTTTSCGATFASNNTQGNLIIASVDWQGSTTTATIADTRGNTYFTAVGPSLWSGGPSGYPLSQSAIYFAKNITAGANTVTLTLSANANDCDIFLHEYSGLSRVSPLDMMSAATDTSATGDSGSKTTNHADELIFGFMGDFANAFAGSGFTSRLSSAGNVSEDKIVSTIGTYSASFTLDTSTRPWVASMATFSIIPSIAHIQTTGLRGAGQTVLSNAFASSTTAGNLIVTCPAWDGVVTIASLSDSVGDTYVPAAAVSIETGNNNTQCFYAKNIVGGMATVTVTFTASTTAYSELYMHEYAGIDTVNPLDSTSTATSTGSKNMNTGTSTAHSNNELIFAHFQDSTVLSPGYGFTARSVMDGNLSEDQYPILAGSYSANASQTTAAPWEAQMLIFKGQ